MKKHKSVLTVTKLPLGFLSVFLLSALSYLISLFYPKLIDILALRQTDAPLYYLLHLITHMFDHANLSHISGNFIFGGPICLYLEKRVGFKKFLTLWFSTGILGALFFIITPSLFGWTGMLGSSVAVSGCVMYGLLLANENKIVRALSMAMALFLFLEQYIMTCYAVVMPGGVAYAGHLGGMLAALFLFVLLEK